MNVALKGLATRIIDTSGSQTNPIVVAMHGIGSNENDLVPAFRTLAEQATLVFPRSPLDHPPGYAWYRLIRIGVPDPQSFALAIETLGGWIDALRAMPGNAERPLILSGFSQGAIMALSYALRNPAQVAGVMAFSGYIPQMVRDTLSEAGEGKPRVFLTQGRRDQLFPFSRLEETAQLLEVQGIRTTVAPHEGAHEIPIAVMESAKAWLAREFQV